MLDTSVVLLKAPLQDVYFYCISFGTPFETVCLPFCHLRSNCLGRTIILPGYCGFYFLNRPGSTGIYSGERFYFITMLPLCNISASFPTAVRFSRRLTPLILIRVCSLTRRIGLSLWPTYSSTQRREEAASVSLFSNCDFSYKKQNGYWSLTVISGWRRLDFCCKDFCANEILFCTLFYCVKVYFTTLLFLQWSLSCVSGSSS